MPRCPSWHLLAPAVTIGLCDLVLLRPKAFLKLVKFPGHGYHHSLLSFPPQVLMPVQLKSILQVGPATKMRWNLFQKPRVTCKRDVTESPPYTPRLYISHCLDCVLTFPPLLCQGVASPPNLTPITMLELLPEDALCDKINNP